MPTTRLHPLTRLFYCGVGLAGILILTRLIPALVSVAATIWNGHPLANSTDPITLPFKGLVMAIYFGLSLAWINYCRTLLDRHSLLSLGLRTNGAVPNLLSGTGTGALTAALLAAVLWLSGSLQWGTVPPDGGTLIKLVGNLVYLAGYAFIIELAFTGYALQNLNESLGWKSAAVTQALLFAATYFVAALFGPREELVFSVMALPSLFSMALLAALAYRKTGSLWFSMAFRWGWLFFAGPVLSLPNGAFTHFHLFHSDLVGSEWLTGGSFGVTGALLMLPVFAALIFFLDRPADHPQAILDLELSARDGEAPALPEPIWEPTDMEDENRESRFRTKFGSSQGFSAETLQELRQLQETREREQRAAQEAAQRADMAQRAASLNVEAPKITVDLESKGETAPAAMQANAAEVPAAKPEAPEAIVRNEAASLPSMSPLPNPAQSAMVVPVPPAAPMVTVEAPKAPTPAVEPKPAAPVTKKPPAPRW